MLRQGGKARTVQVEVIEAASPSALQDALNLWLSGANEIDLINADFQMVSGAYTVIIWYTGGN